MNKNAVTKSQLAMELGFSLRTLQRRLGQEGLRIPRGLIGINQQKNIKIKLGYSDGAEGLEKNAGNS